jgi:hypothetical protein
MKEFLSEKPEREFEEIIDEVMSYLQKRVESFTTALASAKLANYVTTLCGVFNKVITFSPRQNTFVVEPLPVTGNVELKEPREVYAHLPFWLFNAVRNTCVVLDANGLKAHMLNYLSREAERLKEKIHREGSIRIYYNFIINALKKGWSEIPVKPLSIQNIETSLNSLSGYVFAAQDPQLKQVMIEVVGASKETKHIILKKLEESPPPPPPPPPQGIIGISVKEINNVMMILSLIKGEKQTVRSVSLNIRFNDGGNISLSSVATERFEEIFGGFDTIINKIGRLRDVIREIGLTCQFIKGLQKEEVERLCRRYGLGRYEVI